MEINKQTDTLARCIQRIHCTTKRLTNSNQTPNVKIHNSAARFKFHKQLSEGSSVEITKRDLTGTIFFIYIVKQSFISTWTGWRRSCLAVSWICARRNAFQRIRTSVALSNILKTQGEDESRNKFIQRNKLTRWTTNVSRSRVLFQWFKKDIWAWA